MAVPAILDKGEFEVVQMLLKSRSPAMIAPRFRQRPNPPYRYLLLLRLWRSADAAHR
jgi:hypothetical protein